MSGYAIQEVGQPQDWTITWTGFSANPTSVTSKYTCVGKEVTIWIQATAGTSNATTFTITLPFPADSTAAQPFVVRIADNSNFAFGRLVTRAGSNIADVYPSASTTTWTAANLKVIQCAGLTYIRQ